MQMSDDDMTQWVVSIASSINDTSRSVEVKGMTVPIFYIKIKMVLEVNNYKLFNYFTYNNNHILYAIYQ